MEQTVKRKQKIKKSLEKAKEELQIKFAKSTLENKKELYDNNLEAIAKYGDNLGIRVIRSENLKDMALNILMKNLGKNKVSFSNWLFGENREGLKFTELDKINEEIKHIDKLNNWANQIIKELDLDTRKKIAKDIVENMCAWNLFSSDLIKLKEKK